MKKLSLLLGLFLALLSAQHVIANGAIVPQGFQYNTLATGLSQPKGIISAHHRAGAGLFGHSLYVAESGTNSIVSVDKGGAGAAFFANTTLSFPVGVAFYGGPYAQYLYVGNAFSGGIDQIDYNGNITPFALPGVGIAGLDFGRAGYGNSLYAGGWTTGNIWKVDPAGNASLFVSVPGTQTRYLKFSHGNKFGTHLYFTDYLSGDIYVVDPQGNASVFASTGAPCLEGLAFSPGAAFGHFMYAGDVCTGDIFQIAPDGSSSLWASGFPGVADIHFEPGGKGGFNMYIVDGNSSVYSISII